MLIHDWISIKPEVSTGVLQIRDNDINVGIVKEVGSGYWADNGSFIDAINSSIKVGDKIFFTQFVLHEIDGVKQYRVRGRDVIEVLNAKV